MPIISHSIATQNENHFAITVESRQSAQEHTQSKRCHQLLPATKITREQQWRRKVEISPASNVYTQLRTRTQEHRREASPSFVADCHALLSTAVACRVLSLPSSLGIGMI
jgi:hypothetical protein